MSIASVAGQFKTEIKIDPEFESFLPALSEQEFNELEQNLIRDGVREPLVTWCGLLIDGHNRWKVIQKHSLLYETREKHDLNSRAEVKKWQYDNQNGKRNLTIEQRVAMAVKLEPVYAELARERQKQSPGRPRKDEKPVQDLEQVFSDDEQIRSSSKLMDNKSSVQAAKSVGVSHETVRKYKEILKAAPEMEDDIQSGKIKIDKAFRQIRKQERRENYEKMEWPNGKYRVIYADPPWSYEMKKSGHGDTNDHYDTLSIEQICQLPVRDLIDDECVLFLWVTVPLLEKAFEVLKVWGFEYRTSFVWDKGGKNIGSYSFVNHEYLIIATYGKKPLTPEGDKPDSVIRVERSKRHSEKPEQFRAIIDRMYPNGNRIELFARKEVDGWTVYGNEIKRGVV